MYLDIPCYSWNSFTIFRHTEKVTYLTNIIYEVKFGFNFIHIVNAYVSVPCEKYSWDTTNINKNIFKGHLKIK